MSERRRAGVLCALGLLMAATLPAQEIERQRRVVDSLLAIQVAARARISRFDDSVRAERSRHDTVMVAPLRILTPPGHTTVMRAAAEAAVDSVSKVAGAAAARLESVHFVAADMGGGGRQSMLAVTVVDRSGHETISDYALANETALRNALARLALGTLAGTVDFEFRRWAGGAVGWDTLTTDAWRHVRLRLLSERHAEGQPCYEGDLDACTRLLLTDAPGHERQWNYGLRLSLASVAVQAGGSEGFQRLLLSDAAPIQRLEETARLPMDSIIAHWQSRARYARSPSDDMRPGMAVASTFWILLMGACSLRSSRWR